jgi:hypothetical protein
MVSARVSGQTAVEHIDKALQPIQRGVAELMVSARVSGQTAVEHIDKVLQCLGGIDGYG